MTEILHTHGRRMSLALKRALDNLTGDGRRRVQQALSESSSSVLGPVHRALALELHLCDLRDDDTLRRLGEDQDDHDERPWPQAPTDGVTWWPEGGDVA